MPALRRFRLPFPSAHYIPGDEPWLGVEGSLTPGEARLLFSCARGVAGGDSIVEIGSYRGRSTIALGAGSRAGSSVPVFAVDPHVPCRGVKGRQFGPEDLAEFYANVVAAKLGEIIRTVALSSSDAAKAWSERNIGLLFIDGDHQYEAVRRDVGCWLPFVVPGGCMALHDSRDDGVEAVLREMQNRREAVRVDGVDSLTLLRRTTHDE